MIDDINHGDDETLVNMSTFGNIFSIVGYPVGYYFDVFKGGCVSLENKVCFAIDMNNNEFNIGRGGGGVHKFVFAILDHSSNGTRLRS